MQVDTNVSEADIGGIKPGDHATFTVDAFPKRTFEGRVAQVRQSPQSVQNVVTFDVVVEVDNRDLSLKPGMTAATRIVTDRHAGVLRVPNQAVRYRPGGLSAAAAQADEPQASELWVLKAGRSARVSAVFGLQDESFTEIVQADVKEGDAVVVGEAQSSGPALPGPRF